jgi:hypothetical protein
MAAGIAGAALLVGTALGIDALSGSSPAPMAEVATSASAVPSGAPVLVYGAR